MAASTPKTVSLENCSCLYWAPFTCSCLLVKDGLLIPLKNHVLMYCHSSQFSLCPHYQQLVDAEHPTEIKQPGSINRRRSISFPGYHDFYFSKLIGRPLFKTEEEKTWTFDVSDHGVRFASEQLLTSNTAIHFFIEDEEIAATIDGVGRVIWCDPLKDTPLFQVGIAIGWLYR